MEKRRKRKNKNAPFVMLPHKLLDSKAWQESSCYAHEVYTRIMRTYNGKNGNNLSYTYREGTKIMSKRRFTKALEELVGHGLIDIIRSGGLFNRCTIFGLSDRWKFYGEENFKLGEIKVPDKFFGH